MKWVYLPSRATWPVPNADLTHALRYGDPTHEQLSCAASILSAYAYAMLFAPEKDLRAARKAIKAEAFKKPPSPSASRQERGGSEGSET